MFSDIKIYDIADFTEFFIGVLTIIAAVLAIYTFLFESDPLDKIILFSFISLGCICLMFFIKLLKISGISSERLSNISGAFHNLTEKLRDEFYEVKVKNEKKELTTDYLAEKLSSTTNSVINSLAEILSVSTNKKVCAVIKYFNNCDKRNWVIDENAQIATLCRSDNSQNKRKKNAAIYSLAEDTDLSDMVFKSLPHFTCSNLINHSKRVRRATGSYKQPNSDWQDYYKSTIIVPIRIQQKFINIEALNEGVDIRAFLCVDSISKSAFRDGSEHEAYLNIIKAFADCLYKYFDRLQYYQEVLNKR